MPIDQYMLANWRDVGALVLGHLRSSPLVLTMVFNLLRECSRTVTAAPPRLKVANDVIVFCILFAVLFFVSLLCCPFCIIRAPC